MSGFVSRERRTEAYKKAVKAIRELMRERSKEGDSLDLANRAFAEAVAEGWRDLFIMSEGVKSRRTPHVCLSRLKGERCRPMECSSPGGIPGKDHVSEWVKNRKTIMIVSQPYRLSYEDMMKTVEFCEANGLRADVSADSWYFPGRTLLVVYRQASRQPSRGRSWTKTRSPMRSDP